MTPIRFPSPSVLQEALKGYFQNYTCVFTTITVVRRLRKTEEGRPFPKSQVQLNCPEGEHGNTSGFCSPVWSLGAIRARAYGRTGLVGGVPAASGDKAPEALRMNITHRVLPALPPFWGRLPSTRPTQPASCMHLLSQGPRRTGVIQRNTSNVEREATLGEGINAQRHGENIATLSWPLCFVSKVRWV